MGRWILLHRSIEEIKQNMLENISNTEDKTENSLIHDALAPASIEFFTMYRNLEDTGNKIDVEHLEGRELDRFINQRTGLKRKLSTFAVGSVIISGKEGIEIKQGLIVSAGETDFEVTEAKTIGPSGNAEVEVKSAIEGSAGNVPVNAINEFSRTVPGLIDIYNPNKFTNGYDEENDREFIDRYYEKLQRPAKSGNKYHYEQWAKEVTGIGGVKVIPRFNGPLTVKVILIDSNGLPAGDDLVASATEHIEDERPFGADVTVVSAVAKDISVSISLTLSDGYDHLEVKEEIKNNIAKYLADVAFKVPYISYAKIGSIALDTEGVLDYTDLLVNLGTSNVSVASEEVAVVGGVS